MSDSAAADCVPEVGASADVDQRPEVDDAPALTGVAGEAAPADAASAGVPSDGAGVATGRAPEVGVDVEVDQRPEVDDVLALADVAEDVVLLGGAVSDGVPVDGVGVGVAAGRALAVCAGDDADERATVGDAPALDDVGGGATLVEFMKTVGRGGGFAAGGGAAAGAGRAGGTVGIVDFESGLLGTAARTPVLVGGADGVGFFAAAADAVAEVGCVAGEADCVPGDVGFEVAAGRTLDAVGVSGLAGRALGDVEVVRAVVCPAFVEGAAGFAAVFAICVAAPD